MSSTTLSGGCLCGAVRYEVQGMSRKVASCHCSMCRRHSGAAYLTYAAYPRDSVRFTQGRPVEYRSSEAVVRSHCAVCGSPLTYVSAADPGTVWLTVGSLDDPDAVQPTEHWHVATKLRWVSLDDDLLQWPGDPEH